MEVPRLENWMLRLVRFDSFVVIGEVYNHPREDIIDGKTICTSLVVEADKDFKVIKTKNTTYHLGEMSDCFKIMLENMNQDLECYRNLLEKIER